MTTPLEKAKLLREGKILQYNECELVFRNGVFREYYGHGSCHIPSFLTVAKELREEGVWQEKMIWKPKL